MNIFRIPYKKEYEPMKWDISFPLIRDASKCVKCMRCVQVCDKVQTLGIWDLEGTGSRATVNVSGGQNIMDMSCVLCGQCITHCPVGALRERDDTDKVWAAIDDPKKITVMQVAPAVRAAWGEQLGLSREEATIGKIFDAARKLGIDYVFDTSFSADLTIMEEGTEFISRFTAGELKDLPMFTSCCPGWIRFIKTQYPDLVPQLSSAKSPQQMFGAVMKSYFAKSLGVSPEDIFTVSIMPCVAKKGERNMAFNFEEYSGHETDVVLTTRELVRMVRSAHLAPRTLQDVEPDRLMHDYSGAGVIFGATGGVMEAALRSVYFLLTGSNPDPDAFSVVRSTKFAATNEAEVTINGIKVRAAVVSGLGHARELIDAILRGDAHYDFVEVMACPGGCVGGGGQPIHNNEELALTRGDKLYQLDKKNPLRFSHENADIQKLYADYMGEPNGHLAHHLLHTDHEAWECPTHVYE